MRAILVEKGEGGGQTAALREVDETLLMPGDVTLRVTHSTVNYKDGLALTGKAPVVRRFPMVPGIDLAGIVEASDHPGFARGDAAVLNGWGVGETHWGGYAERACVRGDWLIPLPASFTAAEAMAVGTAGYTAALCALALERHGLGPAAGPAVVTGAAGGVGSVATALLARAGWHVLASTGRAAAEGGYLRGLGAAEVLDRAELEGEGRPLLKERWAAGVDSVGSRTLANLLASTRENGAVAACGLAGGMDLPATVAPFILRGVALLGINSVTAPRERRLEAWARLARDLDRDALRAMTRTIRLEDVPAAGREILEGRVRGRIVVEIA